MTQDNDLKPSSSLLLVREMNGGIQVFMMRRSLKSNFGGIWVFPGGLLEEQDKQTIENNHTDGINEAQSQDILSLDQESLPYWVACLRETFEETGALLAKRENKDTFIPTSSELVKLDKLRADLLNGDISFPKILGQLNLHLALDQMIYLSHWITPKVESKRYTTRFFISQLSHQHTLKHDGIEGIESKWIDINDALKDYRGGRMSMIMPTIKNLELIKDFIKVDDLMNTMNNIDPKTILGIEPKFFLENGKWKGLLPGEDGYEDH